MKSAPPWEDVKAGEEASVEQLRKRQRERIREQSTDDDDDKGLSKESAPPFREEDETLTK